MGCAAEGLGVEGPGVGGLGLSGLGVRGLGVGGLGVGGLGVGEAWVNDRHRGLSFAMVLHALNSVGRPLRRSVFLTCGPRSFVGIQLAVGVPPIR